MKRFFAIIFLACILLVSCSKNTTDINANVDTVSNFLQKNGFFTDRTSKEVTAYNDYTTQIVYIYDKNAKNYIKQMVRDLKKSKEVQDLSVSKSQQCYYCKDSLINEYYRLNNNNLVVVKTTESLDKIIKILGKLDLGIPEKKEEGDK